MRGIGFYQAFIKISGSECSVRRSSRTREDRITLVKGEIVDEAFVTDVFPCLLELIATVKGEIVGTFCDRRYAIMD